MVAAYEAGSSAQTLASEWQLAKASILDILRESDTTIRRQRRLTRDEIDHAIASYHNGESLEQIGKQLGVAHTTIRTALQRRGIPRRNSKYPDEPDSARRRFELAGGCSASDACCRSANASPFRIPGPHRSTPNAAR
ncbi:helix-turn-helix domain-containing protein [Nocardia vulneris]|uniref:helix-turn-helix domain-containing protein n=1 Tax=Nocardia vulneris TaxID=1141657 RepID=UPI003BB1FFA2